MKALQTLLYAAVLSAFLVCAQGASAHIFIDEGFEDGLAFNRAAVPNVTDVNSDVDTFDDNKTTHTPCLTITGTGAIANDVSLSGANSYAMTAGQGFAADLNATTVTLSWNGQTTGPFQYAQMGVAVAGVTAAAGAEVARFTMKWVDLEPGDWIVRYLSDGSGGVDVVAGLDGVSTSSTTIGHIDGGLAEWQMVTVQCEKNAGSTADPLVGTGFTPGARFYCASDTPGLFLPATPYVQASPVRNPGVIEFSFEVSNGTVYVDDVYWEGGMTATDAGRDFTSLRNLSAFTVPVQLNQFQME